MKKYNVVLENTDTRKRVNRVYEGNGIADVKTKIKAALRKSDQEEQWRIVAFDAEIDESGGDMIYKAVIPLNPITKKNSQQICINRKTGKRFVRQSERYKEYEEAAGYFLKRPEEPIDYPVNLACVFYRKDRRKVDVSNLIEAIQDILVKYGVLKDDNYTIVVGLDGCHVEYDRENPRTEVFITKAI